jgi:hypothetical protein
MKTSLIRKTLDNDYGNITVECQSLNTTEDSIVISQINDSIVIGYETIPNLIKHLNTLLREINNG